MPEENAEAMKALLKAVLAEQTPGKALPERPDLRGLRDLSDECRALEWADRPVGAREMLRMFGQDEATGSRQPLYRPRPGLWATRTPHYHFEIDESMRPQRLRIWFVKHGRCRLSLERYWIGDEWQSIQ